MTTSNHKKVLTQIGRKPGKVRKFKKHNAPKKRSCGRALKKCARCGRTGAHISLYGLDLCRQCFRETAPKIGFKKYS